VPLSAVGIVSLVLLAALARPLTADPAPATPFTSTRPGEVVVPVTVGTRGPFRFLLDTGSTHTAVTAELADVVDARAVARTAMRTPAGTADCVVAALPRVAIGEALADDLTATVLPPAGAAALGAGIVGVLGQDFLARFTYTIDYRRSVIVWHAAGYVADGVRLTLVPGQDRWLVELPQAPGAAPCGHAVHRFVPDSGADTLVLFDEAPARRLVADWGAAAALGSLTGARGVRLAFVDGLRVGSAILGRQIAAFVPAPAPDAADGLLPLHLFARVFFSARDRALVVEPR
jgi:hypothetical protein